MADAYYFVTLVTLYKPDLTICISKLHLTSLL